MSRPKRPQHTAPTSDELNQVLSDYCDNFQCDGADGEDEPVTDWQRKFARGVIDGLLADPEWDELWGRQIEEMVRQRMTAKQPADGVVVPRGQLEYIANNLPDDYPASAIIALVRNLLVAAKEPRK